MAFFAFVHMTCFISFLILNEFGNETVCYVPKRSRPPKSVWIKSFIKKLFDGPPRGFVVSTYPPIWLFTTTFEKQVGSSHVQASPFNSDSQTLMVDDGASACITNDKNDFIGTTKTISRKVNGFNGQVHATHRGAVRWFIEDDKGMTHVFTINGAYLVPTASTRILSSQHLAQQAQDHYPRGEGMGSTTLSKNIMLFWNQRKHTKIVPLDPKLNVGITTTAAGAKVQNDNN